MARGMNLCQFIGNVGAKPELRYTQAGTAVCNFNIAVTEVWSRDGEKHERTIWIRCVTWRGLAEVAGKHLDKGTQVYVAGKLQERDWTDRDQVKRTTTEVHLVNMLMLGRPGDAGAGDDYDPNIDPPHADDVDDQIPF